MKKVALVLVFAMVLAAFAGCTGDIEIQDGTYRAEYADFDQQGYKDFIEVVFVDGQITEITADAVSGVDGSLKSQSEDVKNAMQTATGTYPEKFYKDLINQYLQNPDADSIDIVAGATNSTNSFVYLAKELEKAIRAGETGTIVVDRP